MREGTSKRRIRSVKKTDTIPSTLKTMAQRQVKWAHKAKRKLRKALGGKCVKCTTTLKLEFDCIQPQGHWHHKIGLTWRISFYRQQAAINNLQLLCEKCHLKKTACEIHN